MNIIGINNQMMKKQFNGMAMRFGIFIMVIMALTACGNADKSRTGTAANADSAAAETAAVAEETAPVAAEAPADAGVSFKDENGNVVSVNSLKGKVVFINFWATWCPPCIHEMPSIDALRKSFKGEDRIAFLMVDVDNKIAQSTAFMKDNNYDLPVYTPAGPIPSDYLGGAIPTTVILNKRGEMVGRLEGGRDYTDPQIVKALKELVGNE